MVMRNENTEFKGATFDGAETAQATETSVYIADLLGELQVIAKIGGLDNLSDDIKIVLARHISDI